MGMKRKPARRMRPQVGGRNIKMDLREIRMGLYGLDLSGSG
jgi:hypothetical protein